MNTATANIAPASTAPAAEVRPGSVTLAAVLQVLFALAFLIVPVAGLFFGADVQAAAEAELARQGLDPGLLATHNLHFDEGGYALVIPAVTAAVAAVLAWLNLAGRRAGHVLTLVVQPIFLLLDFFILTSQLARAEYLQGILGSGADAAAILAASESVYPGWLLALSQGRVAFTMAASAVVIVLLLLPPARAFFRR
ncbi:hypothetical protein [Nonomuraea soli]|uniref:Uncharacterized protein n=1 Tax=Nonomuraea soli TaxID=1032476 RepID=A0A7W0CCM1_9ACTN|nr:hypothetical protein [Nonomuraea soli]MBA2888693.1 hypothetical protein [Nonomuraea soli]